MARIEINAEELIPWCERRGVDARGIVAEEPTWRKADDGIHYLLRRRAPGVDDPAQWPIVEVVAPFDDPMPRVYRIDGAPRLTPE